MTAAEFDLQQRVEHSKKVCEERTQEMIQEKMSELNITATDESYNRVKLQIEQECRTEVQSLGVNPSTGASAFKLQPVDRPLPQPEVTQVVVKQEKISEQQAEKDVKSTHHHHVEVRTEEEHDCPECEKERQMRECGTSGMCSISPIHTPPLHHQDDILLTSRFENLHLDGITSRHLDNSRYRDHNCDDPYCRMRYSQRATYYDTPVYRERYLPPPPPDYSWRSRLRDELHDGRYYETREVNRSDFYDAPVTCISTRSTPERDSFRFDRNQDSRFVSFRTSPVSEHHRTRRPSYQEYMRFLEERKRNEIMQRGGVRRSEGNLRRSSSFHDDDVLRTARKTEQDFEKFSRRLSLIENEHNRDFGASSLDNRLSNSFHGGQRDTAIGGHSSRLNRTLNAASLGQDFSSSHNRSYLIDGPSSSSFSSATRYCGTQLNDRSSGDQVTNKHHSDVKSSSFGSGEVRVGSANSASSVEIKRAESVERDVRVTPIETEQHQHSSLPLWMTDIVYSDSGSEIEYEMFQKVGNKYCSPHIITMETESGESAVGYEDKRTCDNSIYRSIRSTGGLAGFSMENANGEDENESNRRRSLDFKYLQKHWKELEDSSQQTSNPLPNFQKHTKKIYSAPSTDRSKSSWKEKSQTENFTPQIKGATMYHDQNTNIMHSLGSKLSRALHDHFGTPDKTENPAAYHRRSSFRDLKVYSPRRSGVSTSSCSPASTVGNLVHSHYTGSSASSPAARSVSSGGSFQNRSEVINKTFDPNFANRTRKVSKLCSRHRMLSQGSSCSSISHDSLPCNVYAMKVDKSKPMGSHHVCESGSNKTYSRRSFPSNGSSLLSKSTLSSTSFDNDSTAHKTQKLGLQSKTTCKYNSHGTPCKYVPIKLKNETESSLEYKFIAPSSPSYPKDFHLRFSIRTPSPQINLEIPLRTPSPKLFELDPLITNSNESCLKPPNPLKKSPESEEIVKEDPSNFYPHLDDTSLRRSLTEELQTEMNLIDQEFERINISSLPRSTIPVSYLDWATSSKPRQDMEVNVSTQPARTKHTSTSSTQGSVSKRELVKEQQKARLKLIKTPVQDTMEKISSTEGLFTPQLKIDNTLETLNLTGPGFDHGNKNDHTSHPVMSTTPQSKTPLSHAGPSQPAPSQPAPLAHPSHSQSAPPDNTVSPDDHLTESEKLFYDKLARTEVVKASMTGAEITRLLRDRRMSKMSNITELDEFTSSQMSVIPEDQDSSLEELNDNDLTPPKLQPGPSVLRTDHQPLNNRTQDLSRSYTTSNFNFTSYNMQVGDSRARCDSADSFKVHEEELKKQEAARRQETLRALNKRLDTIREDFVLTDNHKLLDEDRKCETVASQPVIDKITSVQSDVTHIETPVMKPEFNFHEKRGDKAASSNFRDVFLVKHREKVKEVDVEEIRKRQIECLKDLQRQVGVTLQNYKTYRTTRF